MARELWHGLTQICGELLLLPTALAAIVAARLALAAIPLRTLLRLLARPTGHAAPAGRVIAPETIGRAIAIAGGYVPYAACLTQALAAQALLRWHGYETSLRIGVARGEAGRLAAHAWVEHKGQVVVGGPASVVARYTPLGPITATTRVSRWR